MKTLGNTSDKKAAEEKRIRQKKFWRNCGLATCCVLWLLVLAAYSALRPPWKDGKGIAKGLHLWVAILSLMVGLWVLSWLLDANRSRGAGESEDSDTRAAVFAGFSLFPFVPAAMIFIVHDALFVGAYPGYYDPAAVIAEVFFLSLTLLILFIGSLVALFERRPSEEPNEWVREGTPSPRSELSQPKGESVVNRSMHIFSPD
ncbi:hypothetical protein NHE_0083 [Neorickettsia helminthoeca str. Oregon]|uniref:Transmembrane protein n=1 Tax=Neorickettsia helminthoeca str. Oregon TaxID=1286528 RepID=X5HJ27_9RICK|nr:hypothetical protein [Neorickettsia helminthoeca]AHX11054.1 hypothetical protein NHE_0083 [Neorickettsia helminthoeca str. Oregon]